MDADLADRVGHDHGSHHRAHHHELHGPGPDVSPLLTIDYWLLTFNRHSEGIKNAWNLSECLYLYHEHFVDACAIIPCTILDRGTSWPSADELGEEGGEDQDYEAYYEDRMSIK